MTETEFGADAEIHPDATLGTADGRPRLGTNPTIRSHTVVYGDVEAGERLVTGHAAVIREGSVLGDDVLVGTNTVVDGDCSLGDDVSLQTGVYLPRNTTLGDRVFVGPHAVLTNDPYPLRQDADLEGPTIEDDVSIGANATILPGVTVGEREFVAADALVTGDVPPETLEVGSPAEHEPLPETLRGGNTE